MHYLKEISITYLMIVISWIIHVPGFGRGVYLYYTTYVLFDSGARGYLPNCRRGFELLYIWVDVVNYYVLTQETTLPTPDLDHIQIAPPNITIDGYFVTDAK